jgi:uncharacterized protein with PIN domain
MVAMTHLCPTCNNSLDRKHHEALGEDVLRCRVCRRYSLEGLGHWLTSPDIEHLRQLAKQRDDDEARFQLMMESPISDPMWTDISTS